MAKELVFFDECYGEVVSARPLTTLPHGQALVKVKTFLGLFRNFLIESKEINHDGSVNGLVGRSVKITPAGLTLL